MTTRTAMVGGARPTWAQVVSRGLPVSQVNESSQLAASPLGSTSLLRYVDVHSLIAECLTVTELVRLRRVNRLWRQLFSEPYCWRGSCFTPDNDQLRNKQLRVDAMPWLQQLTLRYVDFDPFASEVEDWNSDFGFVRRYIAQLSACTGLELRSLNIQGAITRQLLRAMPQLTDLRVQGRIYVNAIASISSQLRRLEASTLDEQHIAALAKHPLPQLQHIGTVKASHTGLQQLARACPNLTSVWWICQPQDHHATTSVHALASLNQLTDLYIRVASLTAEMVDAMHLLPHLTNLTLSGGLSGDVTPSIQFWRALPPLRTHLASHQSNEQQHVKLRVVGCKGTDECSDNWWLEALRASRYCTELALNFGKASEVAWQQYLSGSLNKPASVLQTVDDTTFCNFYKHNLHRFVPFVKSHVNLTELSVIDSYGVVDNQLTEALSYLPQLRNARLKCTSPSLLHRALAKSGAIATLQSLTLFRPHRAEPSYLAEALEMIKQALSLREVDVGAPSPAWAAIPTTQLHACLQHVAKLCVAVSEPGHRHALRMDMRLTTAQLQDRSDVLLKLLRLPSLVEIELAVYPTWLTAQSMADVRRADGLNRVKLAIKFY